MHLGPADRQVERAASPQSIDDVVDLDAEIAEGAFECRMPEEELYGSHYQVPGTSTEQVMEAEHTDATTRGAVPLPRQFLDRNPGISEPRLGAPARWECGCGSGRCYLWAQKPTERLFFERCSARIRLNLPVEPRRPIAWPPDRVVVQAVKPG
jgi:hypothetical protein